MNAPALAKTLLVSTKPYTMAVGRLRREEQRNRRHKNDRACTADGRHAEPPFEEMVSSVTVYCPPGNARPIVSQSHPGPETPIPLYQVLDEVSVACMASRQPRRRPKEPTRRASGRFFDDTVRRGTRRSAGRAAGPQRRLRAGVRKGAARAGVLGQFDYLSTVSGGGYIGGWLFCLAGSGPRTSPTDPLRTACRRVPRALSADPRPPAGQIPRFRASVRSPSTSGRSSRPSSAICS